MSQEPIDENSPLYRSDEEPWHTEDGDEPMDKELPSGEVMSDEVMPGWPLSPRLVQDGEPRNPISWADPTPEMLASPEFEAVWQCIKKWDINVPDAYAGYCGATGNHVRAILEAIGCGKQRSELQAQKELTERNMEVAVSEHNRLTSELQAAQAAADGLREDRRMAMAQTVEKVQQLAAAQEQVREKEALIKSLGRDVNALAIKVSEWKSAFDGSQDGSLILKYRTQLAASQREVGQLKAANDELVTNNLANKTIAILQAENAELKQKVFELEGRIANALL